MKTREEIVDLIAKREQDIRNLYRICEHNRIFLRGESSGYSPVVVSLEKFEITIIYNALKENYLKTLKTLTKELDEHLNKKEES